MNVVVLHPNEWVALPGSPHISVLMVDGRDFVLTREPDGTWNLWACPYLLLVKVGRLAWPWPVTPLPPRRHRSSRFEREGHI